MSKDRLATITNSPISVDTPVKVEVHITVQYAQVGRAWLQTITQGPRHLPVEWFHPPLGSQNVPRDPLHLSSR